ncbi:integrase catalytic domain-containing protein [Trichonephila clavipes]|nr:integrase catalytic domain-containing protein [Trichonephila clavipes]
MKEIKNLFPNSERRHVPAKINPADLISGECSPSHLVESHCWEGPLWLVESPDIWPITMLHDYDTSEISLERKKISCLGFKFLNNVRSRISDRKKGQLSLDELESAGIQLIRSVQAQSFTDERFRSKSPMTDPVSLLSERVKDAAVYEVVGVHLAGALYVKRGDKNEEKVVNSRLLAYLSEDMQDLTPITPARFLFEKPTADTKDLDVRVANHFRKRLKFRAKVIEELKSGTGLELVPRQATIRYPYHSASVATKTNIHVDDIVLIGDDWKKRLQWPLARVIKLIPRKDALLRIVNLKTQSCTLIRSPQRVFPLEVSGNDVISLPLDKLNLLTLTDVYD